jgi:hypothetical protein
MTLAIVSAVCLGAAVKLYLDKRLRSAYMDWPDLLRRIDRINSGSVPRNDTPQFTTVRRVQSVIEHADEASRERAETGWETRGRRGQTWPGPGKVFRPQFGTTARELSGEIRK